MADNEFTRISTDDREQALQRLADHHEAGRLDAFEYEDRRGRAIDAETRGELDALFVDLPSDLTSDVTSDAVSVGGRRDRHARHHGRAWGRGRRLDPGLAYTLVPLLATALFFVTHSWVWFLMIPAAGHIAGMISGSNDRSCTKPVSRS